MENKQTIQLQKTRIRQVLRLAEKLRAYRWRMAGAVLSGIGHQLSIVAVSVLGAYLVGLAVEGRLLVQLPRLLVFFILWIALRVTFYFLEMWLSHDVAFKVLADFRVRLFEAIERISPAVLLNMRSGQLASTLMSDVELLEWFFAHSFGSILVAVIVPLILLFCLGSLSPLFPLLMLVFLAAILWIPFMMKEKADRQGALVREQLGEANAVTIEGVQGLKEILSLNFRKPYLKKNEAYMSRLYDSQLAYGKRLGTEGALLQAALGGSMLCVAAAAALLTAKGQLEVSLYPVAVVLAGMTLNPVVEICSTARNFGLIFGAADRVYRVLESRPQVEDTGAEIRAAVLSPRITFENITFRYRPELAPAVQKLSFTVEPGETVALVGHSGAGKSTCVQLLLRHWDPQEGRICIGGRDLREMKLANLHQMTSVVLQDVYLFRETIRENIRLGRWDATDEEVETAARLALAHDFIRELPQGYDTVAGEAGAKLSGGQRQRIAIARALLKNAPIMILDEAVSNLDTENEKEIQESIRASSQNRTTLIVAHRLSTIRSAHRIVLLEQGQVIGIGTFEELKDLIIREEGTAC